MLYSTLLPFTLLAIRALAQSESTTSSADVIVLSGTSGTTSEDATPTGPYVSYSSTITVSSDTPTAITTSLILSTITGETATRTRTVGTTTIFGLNGTPIIASNSSGTQRGTSTSTNSQLVLQGSNRPTTAVNGTGNNTATATATSALPVNTVPCNNWVEFCARSYANITEVGAHNSPFNRRGSAASNQELDVITQLNDGIRLLQGQMHFVNGTPHFCHGSCEVLDAGPVTDYLDTLYDWLLSHPFDVVTLLLGNARKADDSYPVIQDYLPFFQETRIRQFAYDPPKIPMAKDDWPTLASMILSGKRIVIFMDYEANQTAVPWVLDEFSQMWETPFDPTDRSFPCTVQRPPDLPEAEAKNRLYLFNHNLNYEINLLGNTVLVPQIPLLNITNNVTGEGSLGVGTQNCNQTWDFPPKFLNVDYYNVGNGSVFEVAAKFNNVTYDRACCGLPLNAGVRVVDVSGRSAILVSLFVLGVSWLLL